MSESNAKIFVAGHKGLVGSAIQRKLQQKGYQNIITKSRSELDLTNAETVNAFFRTEKTEIVYLAAAKVGGIYANNAYPADFLLENLKIQNNIIEAAWRNKVRKLLFLGSSCIYPKTAPQPIKEEYLLTSPLEPTNEAYAIAKIAGIKLCNALNRQYKTNFISVMPTNLYGPNDNYHPENAHALPMLLRRFHEAKVNDAATVTVWGTGTPRREYLYVDDLAEACLFLMENYSATDIGELMNIGTGEDCTILQLAEAIRDTVGFKGRIVFDTSKPDGMARKLLDVTRIHAMGWKATTTLQDGLARTYQDFLQNPHLKR